MFLLISHAVDLSLRILYFTPDLIILSRIKVRRFDMVNFFLKKFLSLYFVKSVFLIHLFLMNIDDYFTYLYSND
jgi:hypothetical protein